MATAYPPWPTICVRAAIFTNMCLKGCLRAVTVVETLLDTFEFQLSNEIWAPSGRNSAKAKPSVRVPHYATRRLARSGRL
jgi:hypothetical protein